MSTLSGSVDIGVPFAALSPSPSQSQTQSRVQSQTQLPSSPAASSSQRPISPLPSTPSTSTGTKHHPRCSRSLSRPQRPSKSNLHSRQRPQPQPQSRSRLRKLFTHTFLSPPSVGAYTSVFAAAHPAVRASPQVYNASFLVPVGKGREVKVTKKAKVGRDVRLARELWDVTERILREGGV